MSDLRMKIYNYRTLRRDCMILQGKGGNNCYKRKRGNMVNINIVGEKRDV